MSQSQPPCPSTTEGYSIYDISLPDGDSDSFEIPDRYKLECYMGHGAVGIVCLGRDVQQDNQVVAIKKLRNVFADTVHSRRIVRELTLLKHYRNAPYIIRTDAIIPPARPNYNDVYVVMKNYASDLHYVIHNRNVDLTESHIKWITFQLLLGLRILHKTGCIHRDLKPQNILVTEKADVVIADFGLAKGYEVEDVSQSLYVVTRWYRPPELLLREPRYAAPVDMWSFGCILAELYLRTPLFAGSNQIDQLHRIMHMTGVPTPEVYNDLGSEPARRYLDQFQSKQRHEGIDFRQILGSGAPDAVIDLLKGLLQFHPKNRMTAEQALSHPWYAEYAPIEDVPTDIAKAPIDPQPNSPEDAKAMINQLVGDFTEKMLV